jgi:hypothetical protein
MTECPSLLELTTSPIEGELLSHVGDCARCSALLASLQAHPGDLDLGLDVPAVNRTINLAGPRVDPDASPEPGAVHGITTPGAGGHLLVGLLLDVGDEDATVLPVTSSIRYATDHDALLDFEVLGYPAAVALWNPLEILVDQVGERVAGVEPALLAVLDAARRAVVSRSGAISDLRVGPRVLSDHDPRLRHRTEEAERTAPYAAPRRRLHTGSSFGPVVRAARDELEVELDAIAERVDVDGADLDRLERDELDISGRVPAVHMLRLFAALDLFPSRRLLSLVDKATFQNAALPHEQAPQLARKRAGHRSRSRQPPADVRRKIADDYIAALRRALGS